MDWAAWGPTIVSIFTCTFFAGVLYSNQNSQDAHLKEHDNQLEDHTKDLTKHSVEIGMLKAFNNGFNNGYAAGKASMEFIK